VPHGDGRYESLLVEDDGLTFGSLEGRRLRTTFAVERAGEAVTLSGVVEGDGYPEFRRESFRLVVHGASPSLVRLDGNDVERGDDGFHLPNAGTGFRVELTV
jgi:alpha-glucosidase